eukprot:255688_1
MAQPSTFNFNQWVNDSKLNEIKDLLRKHKMTNIRTLRTTSAEYFKLMSDTALLSKAHALPTLVSALQKIEMNITAAPHVQVIRIVISEEEQHAVDKLRQYSSKLSDLEKEMDRVVNPYIGKCTEDIELLFSDLIEEIRRKKEEFLSEMNDICVYKTEQTSDKLKAIVGERQRVKDALNECDNLQKDPNMNRNMRCDQVMNIVNGVMSGAIDIDTKIVYHGGFDFDEPKTHILSVIRSMQLYRYPVAIIDNVNCICGDNKVTVHFTAQLSDEDKHKKMVLPLWIKLECLNQDLQERYQLALDVSRSNYVFQVPLTRNTNYKMSIRLYGARDKPINGFQPVLCDFYSNRYGQTQWNSRKHEGASNNNAAFKYFIFLMAACVILMTLCIPYVPLFEVEPFCRLYRPYMDQCYEIESQYKQCNDENVRLYEERERMESALVTAGRDCEKDKDSCVDVLKQQTKQLNSLEHELGECHVEWGSCEQLGRQKDKLDEKRVEEIEKQKKNFGLCKEQLKRADLCKSQYEEIFGLCKEQLKRTDLSKSQYEEIFGLCKELLKRTDLSKSQYEEIFG